MILFLLHMNFKTIYNALTGGTLNKIHTHEKRGVEVGGSDTFENLKTVGQSTFY